MKSKKARKTPTQKAKSPTSVPLEKKDNKFDFGGLPDRDLKKNLGCG
jgi:hypothetical protein